MSLFFRLLGFPGRFFGIPVPFHVIHPGTTPSDGEGQFLRGDSTQPSTLWHTFLATFVWDARTLLQVPASTVKRGYRVGWKRLDGEISILPGIITTDFVAVKNSTRDRVFYVFDVNNGRAVHFQVVGRGSVLDVFEEARYIQETSSIDDFGNQVLGVPNLTLV